MMTTARAIRDAIASEYAAARCFEMLAARAGDPNQAQALRELAQVAREHARLIESERERVRQGEIPGKNEGPMVPVEGFPDWVLPAGLAVTEALGRAVEAQVAAARCYDAIANSLESDSSRRFRELARAEQEQALRLKELLEPGQA